MECPCQSEHIFHRLASEGNERPAAMTALTLALQWGVRGDLVVSLAWLNRARRILDGLPEGLEHGYLLYIEGNDAMDLDGQAGPAIDASVRLKEMALRHRAPELASFGWLLSGLAAARTGQASRGFQDLDEAMLPIMAGQVPAEWGGDVYCSVIHLCHELRPEYLPVLSGPGADNLARTLQYIPLLGEVVHKVVGAFKDGGGLSYDDYPRFHHIMAADSAAVNDASLLDTIVPLSGCDDALRAGIAVADIGCGEGHALNLMAGAFPASQFTGYDFSADALDVAIAEAAELGLSNGDGLGTVWGRQLAERMLRDAGFSRIEVKDLEDDPFNAYYVARRE